MTKLSDYIHTEANLANEDPAGNGDFVAMNLTRREWRDIYKALAIQEQWDNRIYALRKERVPMAGVYRLLDIHTAATASAFKPDVPKAKKALHEIVSRCLVQLQLLGD